MSYRTDIAYEYDGSFDGLLCCVFRAVYQREEPAAIVPEDRAQLTLMETVLVSTEADKAARVLQSIPAKLGTDALHIVKLAFLSCIEEKELSILRFLRLGYRVGSAVTRMLADQRVAAVLDAARFVQNETHLLKGFTRFSDYGGALAAEIEPKNDVLPLLAWHFRARLPRESFLIYDRTHKLALLCSGSCSQIIPQEQLELPPASPNEQLYRALWRQFYNTVSIEGRYNPKCRQSNMPKRYWGTMTEFTGGQSWLALGK